jgi:hypothetical protein
LARRAFAVSSPDRHHNRKGHAPLAGRTEGRSGEVVDDLVEVRVGHDDAVVLGAAKCLDALPVRCAPRVDILGDVARSDEAHRRNVGVVEDRIDHFLVAMDDVENPVGQPGIFHQLGEPVGDARIALRWA